MDFAQGTELEEEIRSYIQRSLSDDLSDIPGHYLNTPSNGFWVAESAGQIKGMVGIQYRSDEEAELRRMSVASDTRRQGIGRRLCALLLLPPIDALRIPFYSSRHPRGANVQEIQVDLGNPS